MCYTIIPPWKEKCSSKSLKASNCHNIHAHDECMKTFKPQGWHHFSVPQYRSLVYMVYGLLAVWTSMGWTYVTLILSHCILLYSISLVKIRWLCFVTGLCTLATFKCEPFISWQVSCWHPNTSEYCLYISHGRFPMSSLNRQVLWKVTLSCVLFSSMEDVGLQSCVVWVLLWRTVKEKMATTTSWSCSSTTSTSLSSISGLSWLLINFMFK